MPQVEKRTAGRRGRLTLAALGGLVVVVAGVLYARRSRETTGTSDRVDLLKVALEQFNSRDFEGARATLDRRGGLVKPTALDWMLRARIAREEGKDEEALALLDRITDTSLIAAKARLFAGQIQMRLHRARLAERAFRRSLELDARQVQPHRELISLFTMQQRKQECDAQFLQLVAFAELDHVLAFAWSQNECGLLDPKEAVGILRLCVAADPEDRWSRLALATVCLWMHEHEELKDALAPLPLDDPERLAILIEDAMDRGEIDEAERLAGRTSADTLHLNLARAKLRLRRADFRESAQAFRKVLEVDPTNREATRGLGLAIRQLGDPEAQRHLEAAARQDELKRTIHEAIHGDLTDPLLYLKLGTLCESLNLNGQAGAWYRLVLARDAGNGKAREGLVRVAGQP